ncbi:MAG: Beta-lactamase domain protein [Candidatus Roizmanbacteria bacterium GW2011_GWC2_37_13]|uniref:Ribonuclease J n=1 Tax=Candidatus Roizmanbacteria bacterium GW2011_GWC2_37_13 TaxID=1618486 RepID=A0A0G0IR71_9BACT|nr:MAG: RNA-metabolising metallo-beta-lactamase [Candidatus Roizmanbacteria bacterium GW2011_GWC1_37_12]KKQ26654.1 MAG: Beta-lactamase domain protein [Candidatus Roizmanbacteria bacterium GW2011_GWC2_37_13]
MNNFKIRFVPLGGIVGVTKNMYLYELYENEKLKDILVIDCGIGFPLEKELGVDFVIPDISYLKDKKEKIRAILLTHGHEDHIGALPYHYQELGEPSIYASKLTSVFVENKFKERGKKLAINRVDFEKEYSFGDFRASFIKMTHSIPDTTHIIIKTPIGSFYHGSDFKLDLTPPYGSPPDFYKIAKAGHEGILCLLSDCLGSERPGLTLSESIVGQTFEDEMRKTRGKFIMTTFSSNISRIRQCVEAAIKFNRKIIFLGRSMKESTKLASGIGYLPIPDSLFARDEDLIKLPPNKICLIAAGSQGQYGSALSKLADRQNPYVKIKPGDKIIFSSDPIPGNENEVYGVIEDLVSQGADVVYSDIAEQLHSSGHGNQEDLKYLIRFTNPAYFIPIGGTIRHQKQYENLVTGLGYGKEKVFALAEGETILFVKGNKAYRGQEVETKNIYVDAYGVGDIGNVVLRDRKTISTDGVVFTFLIIDNLGRLVTRPRIVSKGFIFEKEEETLYKAAISLIEKSLKPRGGRVFDVNKIRRDVIGDLEEFFFKEKGRRPLIAVEIIQL